METPVFDFVKAYAASGISRLHMPGHKGCGPLGCELWDITEIKGADSLYEADGILKKSEENAAYLFGSRQTFFGTEGSSQCIKAMLALALQHSHSNTILAARNVHKAFIHAAALLDFDVTWLWPEESYQLLHCAVTAQALERALRQADPLPAAVYLTSPDYLGHIQPIRDLAAVCHHFDVPLLVDNAHGAYLHFLPESLHPLDAGADLCCDSAHKTLPVLTGGAYLHVASAQFAANADNTRQALGLFGSTSPSYLILQSLDLCNVYLDGPCRALLAQAIEQVRYLAADLCALGWDARQAETLKLTINTSVSGFRGTEVAEHLRSGLVECEYSDPDYVVMMFSPQNSVHDYDRVRKAFSSTHPLSRQCTKNSCAMSPPKQVMRIREALFSPWEEIPVAQAVGRICAAPTVSCPPAVPIVVSGEVIQKDAVDVFSYYGRKTVCVVQEKRL